MFTHALPFQYCPDEQEVVVLVTQEVPFQYWPDGQDEPEELPEQPVAGVVEQEYKVPLVVLYCVIPGLKQLPLESMVCQPLPYTVQLVVVPPPVELTHNDPFQYWPEGQEEVVDVPPPEHPGT